LVDKNLKDHAFTAGVLHDIGKLVLAQHCTDAFAECFHRSLMEDRPIHDIEEEVLGTTHAEVGAYLLALWGLPDPVVEAVAYHHAPDKVTHAEFDVSEYLQRLGVADQLEEWEQRATEIQRGEENEES
jgi:HD-like signal output (HDOD) protein